MFVGVQQTVNWSSIRRNASAQFVHACTLWSLGWRYWALMAEAIVKICIHHITSLFSIPSALIDCSLLQKHVNGVIGAICCKLLILNQSLGTSRKAHIEVRKLLYKRYCVLKTHLHKKLVESISELAQN
jgi:hypothetical protein